MSPTPKAPALERGKHLYNTSPSKRTEFRCTCLTPLRVVIIPRRDDGALIGTHRINDQLVRCESYLERQR